MEWHWSLISIFTDQPKTKISRRDWNWCFFEETLVQAGLFLAITIPSFFVLFCVTPWEREDTLVTVWIRTRVCKEAPVRYKKKTVCCLRAWDAQQTSGGCFYCDTYCHARSYILKWQQRSRDPANLSLVREQLGVRGGQDAAPRRL